MMMRLPDERGRTVASIESGRLVLTDLAADYFRRHPRLDLSHCTELVELPEGLRVRQLLLRDCTGLARLPARLKVRTLSLAGCTALAELPRVLTCEQLNLGGTRLRSLPPGLRVSHRLDLTGCRQLARLPEGLRVGLPDVPRGTPTGGSLILRDCTSLVFMPDGLDVCHLDLRGCTHLVGWPERAIARVGRLLARGCSSLLRLPSGLDVSRLDVTDCRVLESLPEGMRVRNDIEIANTRIRRLPDSLRGVPLRWRGVAIDERIALEPESITGEEVLDEANAERRHVLLERFGLERFLDEAGAEVLDADRDAGGERKLLWVAIAGDEPLVYVLVHCPSTGRRYILRVPPTMTTCRQAVAWTAGFDDPDLYRPLVET
jgi:hypothetical protein